MKPSKRAMMYLKRNFVTTIFLFLIMMTLSTVVSGAISVRTALYMTDERVANRIPALYEVMFNNAEASNYHLRYENPPTVADMQAIGNLQYVRDFTYYTTIRLFSNELEWALFDFDAERVPNLGTNAPNLYGYRHLRGFYQPYLMNQFEVRGVSNPYFTDIQTGIISLQQGRVFSDTEMQESKMVAMVSENFARTNSLAVGSMFELEAIVTNWYRGFTETEDSWGWWGTMFTHYEEFRYYHEILSFTVVGIFAVDYQMNYEDYSTWDFIKSLTQQSDLHNQIYIPFVTAEQILIPIYDAEIASWEIVYNSDNEKITWQRYVANPFQMGMLEAMFILTDTRDHDAFTLVANGILPQFFEVRSWRHTNVAVLNAMNNVSEMADIILTMAVGAAVLVFVLVLTLLVRERRREVGIYLALGEKPWAIIKQFLIEVFAIATVAMAVAIFVGNMIASQISNEMLQNELTTFFRVPQFSIADHWPISPRLFLFNPRNISFDEMTAMYDTSLTLATILIFIFVSVIIILLATIIPIIKITKTNPKDVLLD